jgi:hypothetical protein
MKREIKLSEALYGLECRECGEQAEFEASFDADGTCTSYSWFCCGLHYYLRPYTMILEIEPEEEE